MDNAVVCIDPPLVNISAWLSPDAFRTDSHSPRGEWSVAIWLKTVEVLNAAYSRWRFWLCKHPVRAS
jgi:hypothetical protein